MKPVEATEYLKNNQLRPREEFVVEVTAREFDELHLSIKELRGRAKWVEPFCPDEGLNALLREIVRADLQMRFIETFPPNSETEWEIYVISRRPAPNPPTRNQALVNRQTRLRQAQNKLELAQTGTPENSESLFPAAAGGLGSVGTG